MIDFSFGLKRKKAKAPLILDIGSEALKVKTPENYLWYFDDFSAIDGYAKAVEKVFKTFGRKPQEVITTLAANIFKARIVSETFQRERPQKIIDAREAKRIKESVWQRAKQKVSRACSRESGILPQDLRIINLHLLERGVKIDGYEVPGLQGYKGKNLEFKILATFLPEYHFKEIEKIIPSVQLVHEAEGLIPWLKKYSDGVFLDIGGEVTQIFLAKEGCLEKVGEFNLGGKIFSEALSEKLGFLPKDARIFKEKYAKRELGEDSLHRFSEIFYFPKRIWFENLKAKLKEIKKEGLLPSNIFLFGGASQLPEIKAVLKEGDWENISFLGAPQIKIFKDPQFVPAFLIRLRLIQILCQKKLLIFFRQPI